MKWIGIKDIKRWSLRVEDCTEPKRASLLIEIRDERYSSTTGIVKRLERKSKDVKNQSFVPDSFENF